MIRISLWVPIFFGIAAIGCETDRSYRDWRTYLGDPTSSQYSALDQINRSNVSQLEVAWIYDSGMQEQRSQIQCNPIVVDGLLFASTAMRTFFAIDAKTGKEIWTFDPYALAEPPDSRGWNRGVSYWEDGGDKRIFLSAGQNLYALEARTGALVPEFGGRGWISLKDGLDRDVAGLAVSSTSPGVIYEDLIIMGTRVSERAYAAPGHIRAYDVRTGEMRWIFHTIPHPGEFGYETWPPDAWQRIGGANNWCGMSLDEERGIVFVPTGSASYDFYGGNRIGENLFANSLVALSAATGERIWHFQTVHHDIWDWDLPAPPNLLTLTHNGRKVDAVAQITKLGFVFVFNRETGEPLFPIEEREVPASDIDGEEAWPTQPFATRPSPFVRHILTESDVTDVSPEAHAAMKGRFLQHRAGEPFIPPSLEGTIIFPGINGGAEWGGAAHDPESGMIYVNATEMPWMIRLVKMSAEREVDFEAVGNFLYTTACASCHGHDRKGDAANNYPSLENMSEKLTRDQVVDIIQKGKGLMPGFAFFSDVEREALMGYLYGSTEYDISNVDLAQIVKTNEEKVLPYQHDGYHRFLDANGYPGIKPPWGTLSAIDLNAGEIVWQVPLGEYPELTEKGIPLTGTENYGGPVLTAGGLIFIGSTHDEMFRAFDAQTGEVLWKTKLPAAGYATPCTYEIDGKQYVVIAAGGGRAGTKTRDVYVAFALPDGS